MRRPFGQYSTPTPTLPHKGGGRKTRGKGTLVPQAGGGNLLGEAFFEGGYEISQRDADLGHLVA